MSKRRPNQPHSDGQHTLGYSTIVIGVSGIVGTRTGTATAMRSSNNSTSQQEFRSPTRLRQHRYLAAKYRAASATTKDVQVALGLQHLFRRLQTLPYRPLILMHQSTRVHMCVCAAGLRQATGCPRRDSSSAFPTLLSSQTRAVHEQEWPHCSPKSVVLIVDARGHRWSPKTLFQVS
ncbi:hypothetical protein LX36DRAFT_651141 [Colletotrichum falcatum]|nr:hypothetical protein LX36DRAFT_651141 [Colletotrichum falcatum]